MTYSRVGSEGGIVTYGAVDQDKKRKPDEKKKKERIEGWRNRGTNGREKGERKEQEIDVVETEKKDKTKAKKYILHTKRRF